MTAPRPLLLRRPPEAQANRGSVEHYSWGYSLACALLLIKISTPLSNRVTHLFAKGVCQIQSELVQIMTDE